MDLSPSMRRIAIALTVALVIAIGINVFVRLRPESAVQTVDGSDDVLTVVEVLAAPEGRLRTVRGFVFEDALGLRFCEGRQRDPVACVGPYLDLVGFDPASVELDEGQRDGDRFFFSVDPVTVVGSLSVTTLTVEEVLPD